MKKHRTIGFLLLIIVVTNPLTTLASLGLYQPLGGRVLGGGAVSSVVTCAATYGPFAVQPFVLAPMGPYFIRIGLSGAPKTAGYILGLYRSIPDVGTCYNSETGAPVPAFDINPYAVSSSH